LLRSIKNEENLRKNNSKEANRLKNILMPKNINKPNADYYNKNNYSYFVGKTEKSSESNSIQNCEISRISKTAIDEKTNASI